MEQDNRWEYVADVKRTIQAEIETLMHEFSFEFKPEDQGGSGKPEEYWQVEMDEIKMRFRALKALSEAALCLAKMQSLPIDWNKTGDELPW